MTHTYLADMARRRMRLDADALKRAHAAGTVPHEMAEWVRQEDGARIVGCFVCKAVYAETAAVEPEPGRGTDWDAVKRVARERRWRR